MRVYSLALADEIMHLVDRSIEHFDGPTSTGSTDAGSNNNDPNKFDLAQLNKIVFWADDHCCQILRESLILQQWILQPNDISTKRYPPSELYKRTDRQLAIVIYPLSNIGGRKFGYLLDQVLIGYTAHIERVSIIHCTANTGILTTTKPQIVTVHDLYQAFIPRGHRIRPNVLPNAQSNSLRDKLRSKIFTAYYRCLFALQFYKIQHVIVDSTSVARQILALYRYPTKKLSVIQLGVERLVTDLQRDKNATLKDVSEILNKRLDSTGGWPSTQTSQSVSLFPEPYILVLGSRDPRKNFQRQLLAWHAWVGSISSRPNSHSPSPHMTPHGTPHIVICLPDDETLQLARRFILERTISPSHVSLLSAVSKPDLLILMANASMLLNATLAEGFGLPVMECLAFGTPVITGQLDYLKRWEEPWYRGLVYTCDTLSVTSIADAITRCYENHGRYMLDSGKTQLTRPPIKSVRTMQQVTQETLRVYSTVCGIQQQL